MSELGRVAEAPEHLKLAPASPARQRVISLRDNDVRYAVSMRRKPSA